MKKIFIFVCIAMAALILITAMSGPFKDIKADPDDTTGKATTAEPTSTEPPASTYEEGKFYIMSDTDGSYSSIDKLSYFTNLEGYRGFWIKDGITYFGAYMGSACDSSELVCYITMIESPYEEVCLGNDIATYSLGGYTLTWHYTEDLTSVGNELYHYTEGASIAFYYSVENCSDPVSVHNELIERFNVEPRAFDPGSPENPS